MVRFAMYNQCTFLNSINRNRYIKHNGFSNSNMVHRKKINIFLMSSVLHIFENNCSKNLDRKYSGILILDELNIFDKNFLNFKL